MTVLVSSLPPFTITQAHSYSSLLLQNSREAVMGTVGIREVGQAILERFSCFP